MQQKPIIRFLIMAIVIVLAVMLVGVIVQLGTAFLAFGTRTLLILLLVAIVVRFVSLLDERRRY